MIDRGEIKDLFLSFLKERWEEQFLEFCLQYPDTTSLLVEYRPLSNYHKDLEEIIDYDPLALLEEAEAAVQNYELPFDVEFKNIDVRIVGYPYKTAIRNIRHKHINKFVKVEGIIRRASDVKPKYSLVVFECLRCGHHMSIPQPSRKLVEPLECESDSCGKKGPFKVIHIESIYDDFQVLEVQESPDSLQGTQPRNIPVYVYNDLAGTVTTGDKVAISGVLVTNHQSTREGKSTVSDIILHANYIEKVDKTYEDIEISEVELHEIKQLAADPLIKTKMIDSIAPSIYGYKHIKEALLLQLMSGCEKKLADGTRLRGDIHVLLIGDPGTAKSQLVRWIVKLSPRGVFNSGKSTSSVGLTAAVVKDDLNDGRWTLEGGSLVMADTGLCVVDEIDKMRPDDVSALHEAMEQQEISISKAGIHASLLTRCALTAAANPIRGRFDKFDTDIGGQINMPPALLSRFDLIFVIQDLPDRDTDARIANHISNNHMQKLTEADQPINSELMRKYITYARAHVRPVISDEAKTSIVDFYVNVRNMQPDSESIPITARSIDGLFRLAEASARIRLSDVVTFEDAQDSIKLVASCLKEIGFDEKNSVYNVDMVMAGGTKSQRQQVKEFFEYVKELETFTKNDIVDKFLDKSDEFLHILKKQLQKGEIRKIGDDLYKTV